MLGPGVGFLATTFIRSLLSNLYETRVLAIGPRPRGRGGAGDHTLTVRLEGVAQRLARENTFVTLLPGTPGRPHEGYLIRTARSLVQIQPPSLWFLWRGWPRMVRGKLFPPSPKPGSFGPLGNGFLIGSIPILVNCSGRSRSVIFHADKRRLTLTCPATQQKRGRSVQVTFDLGRVPPLKPRCVSAE